MRARLRKEVEGLEIDTIYEIVNNSFMFVASWDTVGISLSIKDEMKLIHMHVYASLEDLFDMWEFLSRVSDTNKQAIRESIVPILNYPLTTTDDMFEKIFGEVVDKAVTAVVSVLEGEQ